MVKIAPFAIEQWMEEHEHAAKYNIAESCAASLSIDQLRALSTDPSFNPISLDTPLGYGSIRGTEALRTNVANLYPGSGIGVPDVLITPGAIQANFLVLYSLIGPGDHVICHYPTYQQLYSVPESLGATVSLWKAKEENNWSLDVNELEGLITPQTKLIIINNPNNPTGGLIPKSDLQKIIDIAAARSIYVFSDEVLRPMFHSLDKNDPEFPPSASQLGYDCVIVTGSMSKSFALAGIRLGWIASTNADVIQKCFEARDYTVISVSLISDSIATYALSPGTVDNLLERNIKLAQKNIEILDDFAKQFPGKVSWIRPNAGTTGFVRFSKNGKPVDGDQFCVDVTIKTGVYFVPGQRCFGNNEDFAGYVRIGFVSETEVLVKALEMLKGYVQNEL